MFVNNRTNKTMTLNIGESVFYEKINIKKLNYILNNRSKYEAILTEQEKDMRRTDENYNAYAVFQKIKENVFIPNDLRDTDFPYLKITYKKVLNQIILVDGIVIKELVFNRSVYPLDTRFVMVYGLI